MFSVSVPVSIKTRRVDICFRCDRTGEVLRLPLEKTKTEGEYEDWSGRIGFDAPDLFFYWFEFTTQNESFRLLKYGQHDTNIEDGELWQLSCVSADYPAPRWAKGAVMYQIFPDRFCRGGEPDLSDKLRPFTLHESTEELPEWRPTEDGEVLNNDFFGGTLQGIASKLDYLSGLGVEVLYLNPIFMAFSNHRYDTCDYKRIDPMLGTETDFVELCKLVHGRGMRIILDGVFSHTGSNSVYFDKEKIFGDGAYSNENSPYRSWFMFRDYPEDYKAWWDFKTLPCVDKMNEDYVNFIIEDEDSVIAHWLRLGADGFRLDVADELPDAFIAKMRRRMRELKPDALLIGEVWEDASNKIAYDVRRRYFTDGELDGVMNYPWRTAILNFCSGKDPGNGLKTAIERISENYPAQVLDCTMNLLSGHDRARLLTELGAPFEGSREEMAKHRLTASQREKAVTLLKLAYVLEFSLPGMPSIYYGDEAGMEGCKDPFNRGFYPWGKEDADLVAFFRRLGQLRKGDDALRYGSVSVAEAGEGRITILRTFGGRTASVTVDIPNKCWSVNDRKGEL